MESKEATGFQIVFLMFAGLLLAVPLANLILGAGVAAEPWGSLVRKGTHFGVAILVILAFPRLRQFAARELARPVPPGCRLEVAAVGIAKLALAFAATGALALWTSWSEGPESVARIRADAEREVAWAFSPAGWVRLGLAVLVAPLIEELVCRGFIYRAFERQWGWPVAAVLTSAVFGIYHPHFWSAFAGSIVFICLLRRTGTLWAPILVHMFFNLMLWWPLLGQHVFPHGAPSSDPATWRFHFLCLAFVAVALPAYVWMSRDRHAVAPTVMLEPNGTVSK